MALVLSLLLFIVCWMPQWCTYVCMQVSIVGESGGESAGSSAKIVQWDTAVSCGELGQHSRGRVMTCDLNHRRPFRCMTGGEDTHTLFSGNTPFVRLIVPTESNISTSKGHVREVNCVRFSPDGVWVCSVGGDKVMRLYHGKEGYCVYERRPAADSDTDSSGNVNDSGVAHDGAIYACAWSSDSKFVLTSSSDGTAKLWSVSGDPNDLAASGGGVSMEHAHTWNVAQDELAACRLSSPTLQPVSTSPSSSALSPSGKSVIQLPKGGMQCGCAFVHEQQPVLVGINGHLTLLPKPECLGGGGSDDGHSHGAASPSSTMSLTLSGHQGVISTMAVRGSRAYTADIDGVIVQWDLNTGACRRVVPNNRADNHQGGGDCCEDAQFTFTSPSHLMYQVHNGAITSLVAMGDGDGASDDGDGDGQQQDTIMSVGWDDMVRSSSRVHSADGSMQLQSTSQHKLNAQPNAMAAGKHLLVIVTVNGLVYRHTTDATVSTNAASCPSSPRRGGAEASSASSSLTNNYIEMDLPYTAQCVAVASDDSLVVVGSDEGDLYFYKPNCCRKTQIKKTWTQVHVVQSAHFKGVTALSFSQDDSTLASADVRDVCVWNVVDAHDVASSSSGGDNNKEQHNNNVVPLISKNRWCFHTQRITSLAWMPGDQQILASSGQDDQIYLWSLRKKMKRINYTYVHRGGVVGLSFTHGGKVLVSAGKDGCICQWNVTDDVKTKFGVTL
jgi:WD40 repeat protein